MPVHSSALDNLSTLDAATLRAVLQPVETARGLPNACYIDPACFEAEKHAVLHANWAGLAVASEVPEPGDALPLTFLGMPLLLLRDRHGQPRVFYNICRHRGMILVESARKIEGAIRCPYHSWCYSTEGTLVATPHVGGPGHNTHTAIKRSALGLAEVRSHIWRDVVFINVSGDAAPFEVMHSDLMQRWGEHEQPLFHGGADSRFRLNVNGNWKLAVENYCESYHLPWVHPGLNSYSRLEDHYNVVCAGKYAGQGTRVYRQLRDAAGQTLPDFPGLSQKWDKGAEYLVLYPNVLFGVHRDFAYAIILEPKSMEQTLEHVHIYYASAQIDEDLRARNTQMWREIFEEDIFVVEGMQRGRHAPGFDGGRFSPAMDGPTHGFHHWVARQLQLSGGEAQRRPTAQP